MAEIKLEAFAPEYMRALNQWCAYKLIKNKDANKKPSKIPFNPRKPNEAASSTNPETWSDLQTALAVYERGDASGLSFMLKEGNGLVFIDFDNCRDAKSGLVDSWALDWIKKFNSYTEISQSGTGFHILIFAKMAGDGRKDDKKGVEAYSKDRQVCLNPNVYQGYSQLMHCQKVFDQFMGEFFPDYNADETAKPKQRIKLDVTAQAELADNKLQRYIDKFCSKEKRRHIWFQYGQEGQDRDASQSGIDFEIAVHSVRLGFTNEVIAALIARNRELFGQSAKLGKHPKYLSMTITNARNHVSEQSNDFKRQAQENADATNITYINNRNIASIDKTQAGSDEGEQAEQVEHDCLGPDFDFIENEEVFTRVTEVDWLAQDYVPLDSITWLYGKPSAGKSFIVLSLAMAVATGGKWGSIDVRKGGVAYICGEGLSGIGKRLMGLEKHLGAEKQHNMLTSTDGVILSSRDQTWAAIDRLRAKFNGTGRDPLRLIIIDTKNTCMDGNENDSEAMTKFVRNLRRLQKAFNCSVLVVDHVSKGDESSVRGSTVQTGAAEVTYLIKRKDDEVNADCVYRIAFKSELLCAKPPKDFEEPPALMCDAQVVDIGTESNPLRNTLVMHPVAPRVIVKPRMRIDELSNSQAVCLDEIKRLYYARRADNKNKGMSHSPTRLTVKEWRAACRAKDVSSSHLTRCIEMLLDERFVLKVAPDQGTSAELNEWYVIPNDD